ncbi:hypothetical protein [Actinoplanes sp. NPDC049265]|uniref:hypothetical protein n=1 Tax=Actinoplanes sp. NPDC049265 TaxID=3363902 RepID=UPI00371BF82E
MKRNSKRAAIVAATAVVAIGGGAAAWAAWFSTGSASASGTAGTSANVDVENLAIVGNVRPGHPADLQFQLHNQNDYAVNVTGLDVTSITSSTPGCTASDAFIKSLTSVPAPGLIAASATTSTINWVGAVKTIADPDDACKGASLTVTVSVTAESAA